MKKLWNKLQLKNKILSLFLPLSIFFILLLSVLSVALLTQNSKKRIVENMQQQLILVTNQTNQILTNATYNIKAFSTSDALHTAIRTEYADTSYGDYLFTSAMHTSVHNIMDIPGLITSGYIQTYDQKIYDLKKDSIYTPTKAQNLQYEKIAEKIGQILIGTPLNNSGKGALSISKSIIDMDDGQCLGILSMDLKEELFYQIYENLAADGNQLFYLTNQAQIVLSSQERELLQQPLPKFQPKSTRMDHLCPVVSYKDTLYLIMKMPVGTTEMTMYSLIPYSIVSQEGFSLARMVIIIGFLMILGTIFLSSILSRSLTKPLQKLSNYTKEIGKGNLDAVISLHTEDEIGTLAREFSNSVQNIKELTQQIYMEQNQKKEYAVNLLQAQINPHFLYNCLDNISTLVDTGENERANQMLYHLGRYYRSILSKGRNIITIREELALIEDYMQIQLIRTPELFTYEILADEEVLEYKTLKFLLQPIVENSIIHGLYGYRKNGMIKIVCRLEKDEIYMEVTDNGQGFLMESPDQILTHEENGTPLSFGLFNIHERIQLKFGKKGMNIISKPSEGTCVTLHFPKLL